MNSVFVHATDDEIQHLLDAPERVRDFLGIAPPDDIEEQRILADPEAARAFFATWGRQGDERVLEIDKNWHALHWLLTGAEWEGEPPLNFIILGGAEIGDASEFGNGPPRAFTSDQTRAIHEGLSQISTDDLLSRYDGDAMSDLYPNIWDRPDEQGRNRQDLAFRYDALKQFIATAADQQLGFITYVI